METTNELSATKSAFKGAAITVKGLKKKFGTHVVLDGIDFELNQGETVGILGKSGSGKSVIIKSIVRLIEPDSGSVIINGQEVTHLSPKPLNEIRTKIGFLFQSAALYDSMSLYENLAFPLRRHNPKIEEAKVEEKVSQVLEDVGLTEAKDKWPQDLSGGMRKRAGLARTLMLDPEIILYDEPTTGLDPSTSKSISELLRELQETRKVSSIVITHHMPCAHRTTDRILILKDGKIAATGTYETLAASNDAFVASFFEV